MPSVLPIVLASSKRGTAAVLPLADLSSGTIKRAPDGWYVLLQIRGVQHRLWLREHPRPEATYAAELPLDPLFEIRAHAARRLWRGILGRPQGAPYHKLSARQRERLAMALRALDGHLDGASYRAIAEVLFGGKRISEGAWKTHDLRSRTIRLVKTGLSLMRGGYRALLRPRSDKN